MNEGESVKQVHVSETTNDVPGGRCEKYRVVTQMPTVVGVQRTKAQGFPQWIPVLLIPEPTCGHFPELSIRELASNAII